MTNRERYAEKIKNLEGEYCEEFVLPIILRKEKCDGVSCHKCRMIQLLWLFEEYEEPEVDWNEVAVDTPIFVRNSKNEDWKPRHFSNYTEGVVYAYDDGRTSHSGCIATCWIYAKLGEDEYERKTI